MDCGLNTQVDGPVGPDLNPSEYQPVLSKSTGEISPRSAERAGHRRARLVEFADLAGSSDEAMELLFYRHPGMS